MTHVLGNEDDSKEELKLSKHNYSQYSNKKNRNEATTENPYVQASYQNEEVINEVAEHAVAPVVEAPEIEMVAETVETVAMPETVPGIVVNCAKLNVREKPSVSAEVVCVLDAASEIAVVVANSNKDWVNVCTAAGIEGYCMRKFIEAHL